MSKLVSNIKRFALAMCLVAPILSSSAEEFIDRFTDDFPLEVPKGATYTFIGGATAGTAITVPGPVLVSGTLKTSGFITVPYFAVNTAATLDVVDGTTTLTCKGKDLAGIVTVEAGATLVNGNTNAVDCDDTFTANIYGTLDMGATCWSLGSNNTLNFYEDCTVTGSGQSGNGTFDWIEDVTATMNVYGELNLAAPINIRSTATLDVNFYACAKEDQVVEFNNGSSGQIGTFSKISGAGTLKFTACCDSAEVTYNLNTIDRFTGTLVINNAITSDGGGTFTIGIGNIVTTGDTTPGSKVLNLTKTEVSGATGTVVYNTTSAQINGEAAKIAVASDGVYVAVASTTIGGVTAYYNEITAAFNAVSAGSAGDTLTILNGNEYGEIEGFEYDSETKTYTKLQMVAQFTYGVQTTKYTTLAAACTDAEQCDPVPTVVLLVALGEQTVPSGWEYNTPEASSTTYGTLTKVAYPSYIDPTDAAAVAKYNAWATYVGVTPATAADLEEAYLLNCRPSEVEVAKAAFTFTAIYQDGEGKWVVETTTSYNERAYNGTVTVKRYSDVACETESETGAFFRASLD